MKPTMKVTSLEHRLQVLNPALHLGFALEDGCLGWLQHAVEPSKHYQRQDYSAVLRLFVVPPQQVGH